MTSLRFTGVVSFTSQFEHKAESEFYGDLDKMPGLYNQEVAGFPRSGILVLAVMLSWPLLGTSLSLSIWKARQCGDRKLKLRIFLLYVGDPVLNLMDPFQEFVCWHLTERKVIYTTGAWGGRWDQQRRQRPPSTRPHNH